jgi:ABC-type multidrug transport system fused ATPase/permease subunit
VIFLALLFAVYHIFPRAIDQRNLTARALEADRAIFTSEIVRHQMFVKAWTRESVEICRLEKKNRSCSSASLAKATGEGRLIFLVEILTALMTASVLGYGGWSVVVGRLSFGGMVLFMQYLAFLYAPIGRMSGFFLIYQRGRVGWQRIQEVLRLPSESSTPSNQRSDWQVPSSRESAPEIRFHRVSFGYQSHQLVLSNFSMTLRAGEITAMTGKSGAGKSTLLKLLMGFHLLDEGEILLDQVPISKMALHDLRSQIAYVDQEATLFSGTVLDNLVYGSENVDEYRLRIVCQQLEIDSFVANLPDGYQTCMRDGGTCFSVGQRQRIALGRALASNRQIIIMDEPTAALDPDLESKVVRELVGLLAGRTALIVTHRPKPLCIASQIIELGENLDISRRRPHFEAVT